MSQDWKCHRFIYIPISSTFSLDNNSNKRLYIRLSLSFVSSICRTKSMRSRPVFVWHGQNTSCSSSDQNSPTQSHPTLEYLHCTGLQPKQQNEVWIRQKHAHRQNRYVTPHSCKIPLSFMHQDTGRYKVQQAQTTPVIKVLTQSISWGSYLMIIYVYKTLTHTLATPISSENIKQKETVKMHMKSDYLLKLPFTVRHFA